MSGRLAGADPERPPYRWAMFGAMCSVYFAFGIVLLAIPPMVTQVRTELDVSRARSGSRSARGRCCTSSPRRRRAGSSTGSGCVGRWPPGRCWSRRRRRCNPAAQDVATLWLAIGIIGIGGPLVSLSAPKLVAVWFTNPHERPLAVGLYTTAPALGGVFALLLTNSVLLPVFGDWRSVLAVRGDAQPCRRVGLDAGQRPGTERAGRADVLETVPLRGAAAARALFASPGVRLAMLLGIGTFFITQGLAAWLPNILEEHSGTLRRRGVELGRRVAGRRDLRPARHPRSRQSRATLDAVVRRDDRARRGDGPHGGRAAWHRRGGGARPRAPVDVELAGDPRAHGGRAGHGGECRSRVRVVVLGGRDRGSGRDRWSSGRSATPTSVSRERSLRWRSCWP